MHPAAAPARSPENHPGNPLESHPERPPLHRPIGIAAAKNNA